MDTTVYHVLCHRTRNAHHEFVFVNAKLRGFPDRKHAGCFFVARTNAIHDAVALAKYIPGRADREFLFVLRIRAQEFLPQSSWNPFPACRRRRSPC